MNRNDHLNSWCSWHLTGLLIVCCLLYTFTASAQQPNGLQKKDSSQLKQHLETIVIEAYGLHKKLLDQPSSISYISPLVFGQFGHENFSEALNSVPGLRMETRSPQSFRLNIRGSSFQSPFGVRNVSIYFDGIPITDPGGDTYLNQLVPGDIHSAEIIKGPASSLYGAGTGGAVLLFDPIFAENPDYTNTIQAGILSGSYGLFQAFGSAQWGDSTQLSRISGTHNQSDGYRDHTAFNQNSFLYSSMIKHSSKNSTGIVVHYNDLYYQTPGGLNRNEYETNPKQSRPKAGPYPSAVSSHASIFQKNMWIGLTQSFRLSSHLSNQSTGYLMYTDLKNPTFRNYEFRKEPFFGVRSQLTWNLPIQLSTLVATGGIEAKQGYFDVKDFGNSNGAPDTLQTDSRINNFSSSLFVQLALTTINGWNIISGLSANNASIKDASLYPFPFTESSRQFKTSISPRFAVSKTWNEQTSLYADISNGFSSPTVSELLPSTNRWNNTLEAEYGTDYEIGIRSSIWRRQVYLDVAAFNLNLNQTISQQRDSSGADYYVNAGGTSQHGLEASIIVTPDPHNSSWVSLQNLWISQTLSHFTYKNYAPNGMNYSGNKIPGIPNYALTAAANAIIVHKFFVHVDWKYASKIVLNDANTVYSSAYSVADLRLGYVHTSASASTWKIAGSINNVFDSSYSLGNDINAAAGRYYNAAPGRAYVIEFDVTISDHNRHKPRKNP